MNKQLLKKQRIILNYLANFSMDNEVSLTSLSYINEYDKFVTLYLTFTKDDINFSTCFRFMLFKGTSTFNDEVLTFFEYELVERLRNEGFIE